MSARAMALLVLACALAANGAARAQDSFGAAPAQEPIPLGDNGRSLPPEPTRPAPGGEAQDFGVPAQAQLRPTEQLHAPTPTSIPGGRVVDTRTLAGWMRGDRGAKPLLFHVLGSPEHIAGALQAAPAGQGGSFDDRVQAEFGAFLRQSTGGDMAKPLVFYCQGTHCWMSYNAALRAMRMGYRQVFWYRGGIEAWQQAGLPVEGQAR